MLDDLKELTCFFSKYFLFAEVFLSLSKSSNWDLLIQNRVCLVAFFHAHLCLSLRVLGPHQQVGCCEDSPATSHTARARDVSNTRDRLEASGLLHGSISGEVDHQRLGLAQAFIGRLHAHVFLPLPRTTNLKPALIHYPLQHILCRWACLYVVRCPREY